MTTPHTKYKGADIRWALRELGTTNVRQAVAFLEAYWRDVAWEVEVRHCPICDGSGHTAERHEM